MSQVRTRSVRFSRRLCVVVAGLVLLSGCEVMPSLAGLGPPFDTADEAVAGSSPATEANEVEATPAIVPSPRPVAGNEARRWDSINGPIFDWTAELKGKPGASTSGTPDNVATTTGAAPAAAGASSRTTPPAAAVDTASPLAPDTTSSQSTSATPAEAPTSTPTAPAPATRPPAWQTVTGPIFDWTRKPAGTAEAPAPVEPLPAWQVREQRILELPGWRLNGRVAVSSPEESWSAVVRWEQVGENFHLRLSNALGQGMADLRGVPGEVLLRTADGKIYRAPNAETLLRDVAGLNLPVAGLRYWVLAVADPSVATADRSLDGDSLPVALQQAGWRIEYDRYRDTGDVALPDRLTFSGENLRGKLVVTQWDVRGS